MISFGVELEMVDKSFHGLLYSKSEIERLLGGIYMRPGRTQTAANLQFCCRLQETGTKGLVDYLWGGALRDDTKNGYVAD